MAFHFTDEGFHHTESWSAVMTAVALSASMVRSDGVIDYAGTATY